jgi:hypothetical protein
MIYCSQEAGKEPPTAWQRCPMIDVHRAGRDRIPPRTTFQKNDADTSFRKACRSDRTSKAASYDNDLNPWFLHRQPHLLVLAIIEWLVKWLSTPITEVLSRDKTVRVIEAVMNLVDASRRTNVTPQFEAIYQCGLAWSVYTSHTSLAMSEFGENPGA